MSKDNDLNIKLSLLDPDEDKLIKKLKNICKCKCKRYYNGSEKTDYFVTENGEIYKNNHDNFDLVKARIVPNSYVLVNIYNNKEKCTKLVHRMVAETFLPNPDNKPQVNHMDGDKTNNHLNNLEWVTAKENVKHAFDHNLRHYGEKSSNAVMTDDIVETICKLIESNKYSLIDIANRVNQPYYLVYQIYKKQSWDYITCKYDFTKFNKFSAATTKLTNSEIRMICMHIKNGKLSDNEIATKYNVTPSTIQGIRCKRYHKNISDSFF